MKKVLLNNLLKFVKKGYPHYDINTLEKISYGLEGLYLTISKVIIIFIIAYLFGIFKEMLILLVFYNVLRFTGFGLHAAKSSYCLISSLMFFIGAPFIIKYIEINLIIKIVISIISILLFFKYAPADTEKRPIINLKKRKKYKYLTTLFSIIYTYLIVVFHGTIYSNIIFLSMLIELFLIVPITYKFFNLKYNNYKSYVENY